jgi:hypothetical protein
VPASCAGATPTAKVNNSDQSKIFFISQNEKLVCPPRQVEVQPPAKEIE